MDCLTRQEFIDMFNEIKYGLGGPDSPLWALEKTGIQCEWFVCIKPIARDDLRQDFWAWCLENCKGRILCFSSNDTEEEEWWGFSEHEDAMWWLLKWHK